jgi:hypothetical protein
VTMQAYHGREDLKAAVLAQIGEHESADRVISGTYALFDSGTNRFAGGCAVGCTLESLRVIEGLEHIEHSNHELYVRYLGVPEALARLEDSIFEGLEDDDQLAWPRRFATAIRPGADLSMVIPRWLHWLLSNPNGPVQAQCVKHPRVAASVNAVAALYASWIDTGAKPSVTEWREARKAAADAYAADAYAADAYAADAYAADAYAADAYAAAADAADAADAAAADADDSRQDARQNAIKTERTRQSDQLISLLETA